MVEYLLYGIVFGAITLIIQYAAFKIRKDKNKGNNPTWSGMQAIIVIATIGLIRGNVAYLAALIGFAIADDIGKALGWH